MVHEQRYDCIILAQILHTDPENKDGQNFTD